MNIQRLTISETVTVLKSQSQNVAKHHGLAGSRFSGSKPGTIDLFKYAAWLVDDKPRPIGRRVQFTADEQLAKKRDADRERINAKTRAASELGEIDFTTINWERRLACKNDQLLFEKTYLPMICNLPNAPYHILLAERIAETIQHGGRQAILLPRGGAKTTKCRTGAVHGSLYGRIRWAINVGANERKAIETIETIKAWIRSNPLLLADFPEICYPISVLKTAKNGSVAESQTYHGFRTGVVWGRDEIRFPCLHLTDETAEIYRSHDPESVRKITLNPEKPEESFWVPTAGYSIFSTGGIESGIRGGNVAHVASLETIRPNAVILDDVQNDKTAASVTSVSKLDGIITSAIRFLSKPGEPIAMLMPCTVIESDDLADTYGDPERKPDWRGIRIPMVMQWPEGMDNRTITQETETSRKWLEYAEIRRKSLREHGDIREATDFYNLHRETMDRGFIVSWEDRHEPGEISAIQYAMDLRFEDHKAFLTNMQQVGADILEQESGAVKWEQLAAKITECEKRCVPGDAQRLVAYIDIQAEYFAYVVLAVNYDLSCCFVTDYGTFPEFGVSNYRRRQANDWRLLTKAYLGTRPDAAQATKTTNIGDIYTWGLRTFADELLSRKYTRMDDYNTELRIHHIAMDAQDGIVSAVVRDVAQKFPPEKVIPYHGFGITAGRMGMENYNRHQDTIFEDMKNPTCNASRWMFKFSEVSKGYELHSDVNAWKDYLMERLKTPASEKGSLVLYNAPPHEHELFSLQVCESERPEEYTARGITRNRWVTQPGVDNEFWDCLVGCCCLASFCGCVYVPTGGISAPTNRPTPNHKTFRQRFEERKRRKK